MVIVQQIIAGLFLAAAVIFAVSGGGAGSGAKGQPKGLITVLSPNGGERWVEGVDNRISWKPSAAENSAVPKIDLYITDGSGKDAVPPSKNRENSGYETWAPRGVYGSFWVKVCQAGTTKCDSSDKPFTIASKLTEPLLPKATVQVSRPNKAGEIFTRGAENVISWQGGGTGKVKVALVKHDYNPASDEIIGWISESAIPNAGITWNGLKVTAPNGAMVETPVGFYRILAVSQNDRGNYCIASRNEQCSYDLGDAPFSLVGR